MHLPHVADRLHGSSDLVVVLVQVKEHAVLLAIVENTPLTDPFTGYRLPPRGRQKGGTGETYR